MIYMVTTEGYTTDGDYYEVYKEFETIEEAFEEFWDKVEYLKEVFPNYIEMRHVDNEFFIADEEEMVTVTINEYEI